MTSTNLTLLLLLSSVSLMCARGSQRISLTTESDGSLRFENSGIRLIIDRSMGIRAFHKDENGILTITRPPERAGGAISSWFAVVDGRTVADFTLETSDLKEIETEYGRGRRLVLKAVDGGRTLRLILSIELLYDRPDMALTRAEYENLSAGPLTLNRACGDFFRLDESLANPERRRGFHTFQGAAYKWGQDFAFRLPADFHRENYLGMNSDQAGGGIPLVDVWCDRTGIAVGHVEPAPVPVSLPVTVSGDGTVEIGVYEEPERRLGPGETFRTVRTIAIVHRLDFFDALTSYAAIMKQAGPPFKNPPEIAYRSEWCTWGFGKDFTTAGIYSILPRIAELGFGSVILDDGWFPLYGDWRPVESKFPRGEADMRELVRRIHAAGLKAWLWWTPFAATEGGEIAGRHPDWLITDRNGEVYPIHDLCPAYGPVRDYHRDLVEKFVREWDFDGFKLDFTRINAAPPCYNPAHGHRSPWESCEGVPEIFRVIYQTATALKPDFLIEYCACGVPPSIHQLPWFHLPVTSDPRIDQISRRIKTYKALFGPDAPVLEEYCGVLKGPVYALTIGAGGVPGTFSTRLDDDHERWLRLYDQLQLARGRYLNLYDIAFDHPEGHVIAKDGALYYAFCTNPWAGTGIGWEFKYGDMFDFRADAGKTEKEDERFHKAFSGRLDLRGLDRNRSYRVYDYVNDRNLGAVSGAEPFLKTEFDTCLLLEVTPE